MQHVCLIDSFFSKTLITVVYASVVIVRDVHSYSLIETNSIFDANDQSQSNFQLDWKRFFSILSISV
jgi:hypothetical protein